MIASCQYFGYNALDFFAGRLILLEDNGDGGTEGYGGVGGHGVVVWPGSWRTGSQYLRGV